MRENLITNLAQQACAYKAQAILYMARGYEFPVEIPNIEGGSMAYTVFKTDSNTNISTSITVYPNPATNELNFVCQTKPEQTITVHIYDSKADLVKTLSIPDKGTYTVNTNQWQTGMYYYTTTTDGTIMQRSKLIIIK